MTGIVLALAGIAAGGAGPGGGVAREPVTVGMCGAWEGRWEAEWDDPCVSGHAELRDGLLRIEDRASGRSVSYRIRLQGPDKLAVTVAGGPGHLGYGLGIYKKAGGCLLICIGGPDPISFPTSITSGPRSLVVTLHPATRRKP
jgi:hypothetical protein